MQTGGTRVATGYLSDPTRKTGADEFDQPDGSQPDPAYWRVPSRSGSVWNRWISSSPDVAFIRDGHLVCRAIPNPDHSSDGVPMLTGAVQTRDLFSFTYGRVEVRLRTNLHDGNFPAAWMMPQPPCEIWPNAGEIDIFESIDGENIAYHTVHSHWTYDLGHKSEPASSFTSSAYVSQWHVYGLQWAEDQLTWTIDGRTVATYSRSSDEEVLAQGQWPFSHPFYLILNQSVGNGSWAKAADTAYIYETEFDWVRVYQRVPDVVSDVTASRPPGHAVYDLGGRAINLRSARPSSGFYISGGRKYVVR